MSEMVNASSNTITRERFVKVASLGSGVSLLATHPNHFTAMRSIVVEKPLVADVDDENHHIVLKIDQVELEDLRKKLEEQQAFLNQIQNQVSSVRNHTQHNQDNLINTAKSLAATESKYDAGLKSILHYCKETMQDHDTKWREQYNQLVGSTVTNFDWTIKKFSSLPEPKDHTKHIRILYGVICMLICIEILRSVL